MHNIPKSVDMNMWERFDRQKFSKKLPVAQKLYQDVKSNLYSCKLGSNFCNLRSKYIVKHKKDV